MLIGYSPFDDSDPMLTLKKVNSKFYKFEIYNFTKSIKFLIYNLLFFQIYKFTKSKK